MIPNQEFKTEDILLQLKEHLEKELASGNEPLVKYVLICDDWQAALVKSQMLPCLCISTIGEESIYGPIANINTINIGMKIRIMTQSSDPKKYKVKVDNNVYALTREIRKALIKNKSLNGYIFELSAKYRVKDIQMIPTVKKSGYFAARDIFFEYRVLEAFTGARNNQRSALVPEGIKF